MDTLKIYSQKDNKDTAVRSASDFFRREISETRNFTRQITATKNFSRKPVSEVEIEKKS